MNVKKKKKSLKGGVAVSRMVNDWREMIENCLSFKIHMAQTKNQK